MSDIPSPDSPPPEALPSVEDESTDATLLRLKAKIQEMDVKIAEMHAKLATLEERCDDACEEVAPLQCSLTMHDSLLARMLPFAPRAPPGVFNINALPPRVLTEKRVEQEKCIKKEWCSQSALCPSRKRKWECEEVVA